MIYNSIGKKRLPMSLAGGYLTAAYNFADSDEMFAPQLVENFDTLNTNIWGFSFGPYRDCQYMPEEYDNNVYIDDGTLIVRNLRDNPTEEYEWSGAFIDSSGKFEFTYGIVAAKIRFPNDADHYHSTFWMLGIEHGEIDIAEADSGNVTISTHWYDAEGNINSQLINKYRTNPEEFHTYVMYWDEKDIVFHCDGKLIGIYNVEDATIGEVNSFRQPFYLVFNTNPNSIYDDLGFSSTDSVTNAIEYIRVYEN